MDYTDTKARVLAQFYTGLLIGEADDRMGGFVVCSIVAVIFFRIGVSCRKSQEAVGFYTFTKPPMVKNVEHYNRAVSVLWFAASIVFEMICIPFLFVEQNSPTFIFMVFAMMLLVVGMMVSYSRIEAKYRE